MSNDYIPESFEDRLAGAEFCLEEVERALKFMGIDFSSTPPYNYGDAIKIHYSRLVKEYAETIYNLSKASKLTKTLATPSSSFEAEDIVKNPHVKIVLAKLKSVDGVVGSISDSKSVGLSSSLNQRVQPSAGENP